MSETEQPANQPLTRKQMREIRNTGSTPVITAETAAEAAAPADELDEATFVVESPPAPPSVFGAPAWEPAAATPRVAVAPLPRAADPVVVAPAPVADSTVDLGASPLTRRQARQQERIRTASVPVITPEVAAAHTASLAAAGATPALTRDQPVSANSGMHDLFGLATAPAPVIPTPAERDETSAEPEAPAHLEESPAEYEAFRAVDAVQPSAWEELAADVEETDAKEDRVVNPLLGAGLLAGEPEQAPLPASFDQLLSRSTGTVSMPNALILSQAPEIAPMSAPMSATGEVLITGTLNLPEGLGSTGHALGTADGKEVDATLIDGELPAHSSPTPIAASAAISTVKSAGEVIRPPVPEKGSKLMLTLAITAGALALALVGVLILAFVTGAL
ncbi:hypothetical protein [Microbacterium sp. Root180]|uniref:hypothetical protein n=1 Tax=Microbacterium sp. Root180 TaxID=1736483 RepID=UPI0009E82A52|nr:hypothetical protein [Microbacterium sp. Root180]